MITGLNFDTQIAASYLRNNRSTRQKSLRCFPSCGIKGHISGGFCGKPLKVTIDLKRDDPSHQLDVTEYIFIAEIRPISQPKISNEKIVLKSYVLDQIRTKYEKSIQDNNNAELFMADVKLLSNSIDIATLELSFNSQHCSWDYSWKSNRWSGPQEQHTVDIIVLKSISISEFAIVSYTSSTPFIILSSHKKTPPSTKKRSKEQKQQQDGSSTNIKKPKAKSDLPSINKLKRDHYSMQQSISNQPADIYYPIPSGSNKHLSSNLMDIFPGLSYNINNNSNSSDSNVLKSEPSSDMSICPISVSSNKNIYYQPPIHHFKQSADGKSMKLAPVVDNTKYNPISSLLLQQQYPNHHIKAPGQTSVASFIAGQCQDYHSSSSTASQQQDTSLKEGALALIQLFVSQPKSHDVEVGQSREYLERVSQPPPPTTLTTSSAATLVYTTTAAAYNNPTISVPSYTNPTTNSTNTTTDSNTYTNNNIIKNQIIPSHSHYHASYQPYSYPLMINIQSQYQDGKNKRKKEPLQQDIIEQKQYHNPIIKNNHESNSIGDDTTHIFNSSGTSDHISSCSNTTNNDNNNTTTIDNNMASNNILSNHEKVDSILELPLRQ